MHRAELSFNSRHALPVLSIRGQHEQNAAELPEKTPHEFTFTLISLSPLLLGTRTLPRSSVDTMNGSLPPSPTVLDIKLKRGPAGLGFNIVGGVDQQYVVNDSGIYVSKIKEDGAAALDGRLQEGDKILEINGVQLEDRTHKAVVELFRTAGEDVELKVLKKCPRHINGPSGPRPQQDPSMSSVGVLAVLAGAAALVAFIYMRHLRKNF